MIEFKSIDIYSIQNRECFVVKNDRKCSNFDHLIDKYVLIDGQERKVIDVERFAHYPPWHKGELITLRT